MKKAGKNVKTIEGVVVGNKMQKTVKVAVDTPMRHPVYRKMISKRKIFFAHTEKEHELGETVKIAEARPYAKNVRWVVVNSK